MDNTPMPSLTVHTTVNLKRSLRSAENENASIHQPNEVPHSAKHSIFNELSGKDPEMMNGSSTYMPLPCPTYVLGGNLISYTSEIFTAMEDQGKWIILSSNLPIILFAEFALVSQTCAPSFLISPPFTSSSPCRLFKACGGKQRLTALWKISSSSRLQRL